MGTQTKMVNARMNAADRAALVRLAAAKTGGNLSAALRLAVLTAARDVKASPARPPTTTKGTGDA